MIKQIYDKIFGTPKERLLYKLYQQSYNLSKARSKYHELAGEAITTGTLKECPELLKIDDRIYQHEIPLSELEFERRALLRYYMNA